jgi:hypothetical protein
MTTTNEARATIQSTIDNGYRTLPRPTDFADLLEAATEDERAQLYLRMVEWIGDHNTQVMWWQAEGIRSGRYPHIDQVQR